MQYDADCELFDKIISGDLCEEVYYDQVPRAPDLNLKLWLETDPLDRLEFEFEFVDVFRWR